MVCSEDFPGPRLTAQEFTSTIGELGLAPAQPTGYTFKYTYSIDNAGEILLGATNPNDNMTHGIILVPVPTPEPSTLLLAATGLVSLIAYARRKQR